MRLVERLALRCLIPAFAALVLSSPAFASESSESDSAMETVALGIEGISSASSEDSPGVVYILPWQPPTLPRRTRDALEVDARGLREPMDPVVFDRHQAFHQSLNPTADSPNSPR
jgi:hypothetical protein